MVKKLLVLLILAMLVLAGCGQAKKETGIKVAMVTDVGGVNDQSFNQSAWEGLQRAEKELGVTVNYVESKQDADYKPNMETLLDARNDLILGIGFKMGEALSESAANNPEQKYAGIDCFFENPTPNLVGILFKEQEPSFLVGYIAGKMTKPNKVGFVGGMDFFVIHKFHYGFMAGVKYANPDCEILVQYADSFTDAAKGKAIANQMYKNGADIVYHAAGGTGNGLISEAKDRRANGEDVWAIGVDKDQYADGIYNDNGDSAVLTSMMKRVDVAAYNVAEATYNGEFPGGQILVFDLTNDGVGLPAENPNLSQAIIDEVAQYKAGILDGTYTVPTVPSRLQDSN